MTIRSAVRAAAIAKFGLGALAPNEPMANLRRRSVPIWRLHRYEVVAAATAIGGQEAGVLFRGDRHFALPVRLPDSLRKAAIQVLVSGARRHAIGSGPDAEAEFAAAMAVRPIAEHTQAANEQHYELPAAFFEASIATWKCSRSRSLSSKLSVSDMGVPAAEARRAD